MMQRIIAVARPTGAAAAGPLVSDSFDRADNSTSLGTADTGQTWTNIVRELGIISNRAYRPNAGEGVAWLDSGAADVDITVDIIHASNNGLVFRGADANNYMMARLGTDNVQLYRREAGTYTLVASVAMTLTAGQTYIFRVLASGSTIDVYVDGANKLTATEPFQSTATNHGLYGADGNSRFDNFQVDAA